MVRWVAMSLIESLSNYDFLRVNLLCFRIFYRTWCAGLQCHFFVVWSVFKSASANPRAQGDQSLSCPEVKEGPEREELSNQKEKHQDQRIPKEEENVEKEAL